MSRRIRRSMHARRSGRLAGWIAFLMLCVFVLVAYGHEKREASTGEMMPLPTSGLEMLSDVVRLGAQDYYAIQFGVYENMAAAQEKAMEYVGRGAAGYIWEEEGKYRVLAAVYTSLDDAQTIKERLKSQEIDAYVYTLRQPALEMRVSANDEQRALLGEIFAFLPRVIREIGDVSLSLDKQTMESAEACERIGVLGDEAQHYFECAKAQLGGDADGIIDHIRALLEEIAKKCHDFSQNSQEDLYTTAKIKYNYLEVLWNVRHFVRSVLTLSDA